MGVEVTTSVPSARAASTTAQGARTCVATPGLNRGVTDADCARCLEGYKWWPCNEAILCQCDGTSLLQEGERPGKKVKLSNLRRHGQKDQALVQAGTELSRAGAFMSSHEL